METSARRRSNGRSVGIVVGDGPGLGMAALASLLTLAALVYSWHYFEEPPRRHAGSFPALMLVFQAGMCGFAIAGDLFDAFVFFELMSGVAYALAGFRIDERRAVHGALTFVVVNFLGAYAVLMGIALLYGRTGELAMTHIGRGLDAHGRPDAPVLAERPCSPARASSSTATAASTNGRCTGGPGGCAASA